MGDSPLFFLDICNKNKARKQKANKGGKLMIKKSRNRMAMRRKRRAILEASRRQESGVFKKVRALKKLIPNSNEAMGLNGLFRETADYILSLQMRVKVMQVMVDVLASGSDL